jgi:hypothetical protein
MVLRGLPVPEHDAGFLELFTGIAEDKYHIA